VQIVDLEELELRRRIERPEAALGQQTGDDARRLLALALDRAL